MSNALFPNLSLICAGMEIKPSWNTQRSRSSSGRRFALGKQIYPTYTFKVPFTVLRSNAYFAEYEALRGFFNARKGGLDDFLFKVPFENLAVNQSFGVGDGTTKTFQIFHSLGGFVEPVGGVDNASAIFYVSGTNTAGTLSADLSAVTFASAPANGAALTWSGTFYARCAFMKDELPLIQFSKGLWATTCDFESVPL